MDDYSKLFVGGDWCTPNSTTPVISPYTERQIATAPLASAADVDRAVEIARATFEAGTWNDLSLDERLTIMQRFGELYAARMEDMAALICAQVGSPISVAAMAQVAPAWLTITSFCTLAQDFPWEEWRPTLLREGNILVRREAVGVVGAIVPWNFPQTLAMSKLAPALLAGCSVVLKPAAETPLDALLLAEIAEQAGFPRGVLSVLPGGPEVGRHLVCHPDVDKIAFTGSTATGREIGSICGSQIKRFSLELGGKSAAIVLDDADLELVAQGLKIAGLAASGQVCAAQTRVLVSRKNYTAVIDALADMMGELIIGDPADVKTEIGPLVAKRQQERVERYIAQGVADGAKAVVGGTGMPTEVEAGWFVKPTLFSDVDNSMTIAREEIFGPVLAVIPFDDEDDAVRIANDSDYGLAGTVWTEDEDRAMAIARRVRTGTFAVNQYSFDYAASFGGYKKSGIGREWGPEGLSQYLETKSIMPPPKVAGLGWIVGTG